MAFQQLKEKLWKEGLFDPAHKKAPAALSGENRHRHLRRRGGGPRHDPHPPPPVSHRQGDPAAGAGPGAEAPPEIVGAIRYADRWKIGDVIITGRGGGSMEDLWAFNDERVARAIYDCETPIISAVGHEPDVTIADFVADARASTPSNAAEIAVPDQVELLRWLRGAGERMARSETARLETARQRLTALAAKRVMTDGMAYVQDKRLDLDHLQQRLGDVTGAVLGRHRQKFAALAASLDAMSPLAVLGRRLRRGPG